MIVALPINNATGKYEATSKNTMAAIHATAEEMIRRALVTTVPWEKVCLMARYRSALIKSKWPTVANMKITKETVKATELNVTKFEGIFFL